MKRFTAKYKKRLAVVAAGLVLSVVCSGYARDRQHVSNTSCAGSENASITIDPVGHLAFAAETAPDNVGTYVIDPATGSLRASAITSDADQHFQLISTANLRRKISARRGGR